MNNKIIATTPDNEQLEIEVLDIFSVVGYEGKEYILYTLGEEIDQDHERAYVSILEEKDNGYSLTEINDSKEWQEVQIAIEEDIAMAEDENNE